MAEKASRDDFEQRAFADPYDFMTDADKAFVAEEMEIVPVDATKKDELKSGLSWAERHIGGGGLMSVTDYGRHRSDCDTLADFRDMIREKIKDGIGSQYLKVMDDEKEQIADRLVAVTRKDGYVVVPHFD
jgi:hypothetical protein